MKKYFYLQQKRAMKAFPFFMLIAIVLLLGVAIIFAGMLQIFGNKEENTRFKIAITGDTDSPYIEWGMVAMRTFDETRFSIDFIEMPEDEAEKALASGGISAYVVLPEDFVDKAIRNEVEPIKYVTTPGVGGIVSMFKNEITQLVTDMVVYSQKGTYGIGDAMSDNGLSEKADDGMYQLSLEYVELIFERSKLYSLQEFGIASGLDMTQYFVCGITILLLSLMGIPYVILYTKKDYALNRLLISRGRSGIGQLLCDYASHLVSFLLLVGVIVLLLVFGAFFAPESLRTFISLDVLSAFALRLVPVIVMLSAFNIMIFELSDNMVSGILIHFFSIISLCYLTGCMYPIHTFPKAVQQVSAILPMSFARSCLAGGFNESESSVWGTMCVILYAVLFIGIAFLVRNHKTTNRRG